MHQNTNNSEQNTPKLSDDSEPPSNYSDINIDIEYEESLPQDDLIIEYITAYLLKACEIQAVKSGQISIYITHDAEMAELHFDHTGIKGTTDILTFDLRDDIEDHTTIEVDIVLCIDEAQRQAGIRKHAIKDELLLYSIHGLLHVQGYNDHDDKEYAAMHQQEDMILTKLGIGAIFKLQGKQSL